MNKTYQVEEIGEKGRRVVYSFDDLEMAFKNAVDYSMEINRKRCVMVTEKDNPTAYYLFIGGSDGI